MEITPVMRKVLNEFYLESCRNNQRINLLKEEIKELENSNLTMIGIVRGMLLAKQNTPELTKPQLKLFIEEM